jgi:hypothetical protein
MNRITKEIKAVADAHIKASLENNFTHANDGVLAVSSYTELIDNLVKGETYAYLVDEIEIKFVSVTSLIYHRTFEHQTETYKKAMYKGFKIMFSNLEKLGYFLPKAQ